MNTILQPLPIKVAYKPAADLMSIELAAPSASLVEGTNGMEQKPGRESTPVEDAQLSREALPQPQIQDAHVPRGPISEPKAVGEKRLDQEPKRPAQATQNGQKDSMIDTQDKQSALSKGLIEAAGRGLVKNVTEYLAAGAKLNSIIEGCRSAHAASLNGHTDVVRLLLKAGAHADIRDNLKRTPIHLATLKGHEAVVDVLVAAGCDVNAATANNETFLHYALMGGSNKLVKDALSLGLLVSMRCLTAEICPYILLLITDALKRYASLSGQKQT